MSESTQEGQIRQSTLKTYETVNPFTEEKISSYEILSTDEAMKCVEQAHAAFHKWCQVSVTDRAQVIERFATLLREHKDELANLMTEEMGKRFVEAQGEVESVAAICDYCAANGPGFLVDQEKNLEDGKKAFISYRPQGVILSIQPWNFPLYQVVRYSAPNLISGNTTLLKHAPNVWGMAKKVEELYLKAGLPENAFKALFIEDETVSKLIEHKHIRGVTLTGSPKAGSIVARKAGEELKKVVLELGGSDPYIILEDADLDHAVKLCIAGRIKNAGQTCTAAKRFIVVEEVYEEFKKRFVEKMKEAQMGDPKEKATRLAPLARKDILEKLDRQVDESIEKGAVCLLGGHREQRKGFFFQPTVLENISPGMPAYDEELFGPVACLFKVKGEDEAVRIANDTRYGLGGGVFTQDINRGTRIARDRIDSGMVAVNGISGSQANLPFGGVKDSGFGREHGSFGFHEFVNVKSVMIKS